MWPTIIAIGIIVVVIAAYILSYAVNRNTDVPEGCEDLSDGSCETCTTGTCSMNPKLKDEVKNAK